MSTMQAEWVSVGRDPFARFDLERTQVEAPAYMKGCDWCDNANQWRSLFKYRHNSDGGRKTEINGKFCSIGCMRSYHS
ncbi:MULTISPECIES: hypothetical protein [unclassified Bradyrhizobium]|uniref:hypothetical protein n=1 Tax=unclassified Bradyrhizobium TaxID=2631580 RepID=UPI00339222CA